MTKLTMVSMYANGRAFTKFLELPLGENGKPYVPAGTYNGMCAELNVRPGDTVTMNLPR